MGAPFLARRVSSGGALHSSAIARAPPARKCMPPRPAECDARGVHLDAAGAGCVSGFQSWAADAGSWAVVPCAASSAWHYQKIIILRSGERQPALARAPCAKPLYNPNKPNGLRQTLLSLPLLQIKEQTPHAVLFQNPIAAHLALFSNQFLLSRQGTD